MQQPANVCPGGDSVKHTRKILENRYPVPLFFLYNYAGQNFEIFFYGKRKQFHRSLQYFLGWWFLVCFVVVIQNPLFQWFEIKKRFYHFRNPNVFLKYINWTVQGLKGFINFLFLLNTIEKTIYLNRKNN